MALHRWARLLKNDPVNLMVIGNDLLQPTNGFRTPHSALQGIHNII